MAGINDIWKKFQDEILDSITHMERELANQTTKDYHTVLMMKFVIALVQRCGNVHEIDLILTDIKKQLHDGVGNININTDVSPEAIENAQKSVHECIEEAAKSVRNELLKIYTDG